MPNIKPFKALRFNTEKVGKLSDVISPPYDVIPPELRKKFADKSPYNTVHLILPEGEGDSKYSNAKNTLMSWILRDVLIVEEKPSIYIWYQTFPYMGKNITRKGFISVLKLEELGTGVIPHEKTLKGPKEDRLKLLKATNTNFGHIFMLYSDPQKEIISKMDSIIEGEAELICELTDYENTKHQIWKSTNPSLAETISSVLANTPVYIADGHHRYETSLAYAREKMEETPDENAPFNYVMCTFFNFDDRGIVILPTHRLIKKDDLNPSSFMNSLLKFYKASAIPFNDEIKKASVSKFIKLMRSAKREGKHSIGVFLKSAPSKIYFLQSKSENIHSHIEGSEPDVWKKLDVVIVHKIILEQTLNITEEDVKEGKITYVRGEMKAIEKTLKGEADIAILVNPIDVREMKDVADAGISMPQKSTDFYPKLPSGFTFFNFKYSL